MEKTFPLPPNLPPMCLDREASAAFVDSSPTHFDALVKVGVMPAPRKLSERRFVWLVRELQEAARRLPVRLGKAEAG